jgi:SAM-dependent methyltransferase
MPASSHDASSGYDRVAHDFIASRSRTIGIDTVGAWARQLRAGALVLDLAAGNGVPLTGLLIDTGLQVSAMDASPRMTAAFRQRFPGVGVACATGMRLPCRAAAFDAVLAWGLIFLRPATEQHGIISEIARVMKPGGRFLFTAPAQVAEWRDNLTGLPSVSLGAAAYRSIAASEGFTLLAENVDEGDNYYYSLVKQS